MNKYIMELESETNKYNDYKNDENRLFENEPFSDNQLINQPFNEREFNNQPFSDNNQKYINDSYTNNNLESSEIENNLSLNKTNNINKDTQKNKWTNGTVMEKSLRTSKVNEQTFLFKNNKRDKFNDSLMSRHMVKQTNSNPFLANRNYLEDLKIQDDFLKPKNSNQE